MKKKIYALAGIVGIILLSVFVYTSIYSLSNFNGTNLTVEMHLWAQQYRDGKLISASTHPMTLTNFGKNWIADKIFNSNGVNVTKFAMYIACSNSTEEVNATWTALPSEITAYGLLRALAEWTDTGTGTGNLTKSFSVTGTVSTQLYGLYVDTYANEPVSGLVAAEQQGGGNVKNLQNGDTLIITIQVSVS